MLEQLELLLELQEIDSELGELLRRNDSLPARIAQLKEEKAHALSARESKQLELDEAMKEHRRRERELEDASAKINDLKAKQLVIKTNEEYAALTHEIEFAGQEISDVEDAILKLLEDIERLKTEAEQAAAESSEAERELDEKVAGLKGELDELESALAVKRDERLRVAMRVDGGVLRRYEGILASKGDVAVARIEDGACSGCYKSLPPQTVIEVKRGARLTECDGCGRILCWRREDEVG